jgi:hypothetical protein
LQIGQKADSGQVFQAFSVRVVDAGEEENVLWIVTEWLRNCSLPEHFGLFGFRGMHSFFALEQNVLIGAISRTGFRNVL